MNGGPSRAAFWADHYYDDGPMCFGGDCCFCPSVTGCLEARIDECPAAYDCTLCEARDACEDPLRART